MHRRDSGFRAPMIHRIAEPVQESFNNPEAIMRKIFAMVLISIFCLATGAQANCGPAHPCEGDYCTH